MKSVETIIKTLKATDNEGTESPYWLIIDPSNLGLSWKDGDETVFAALDEENVHRTGHRVTDCITGPFFSREDAAQHLKARRYAFSDQTFVYCHSGYASRKYKTFCQEIEVGK